MSKLVLELPEDAYDYACAKCGKTLGFYSNKEDMHYDDWGIPLEIIPIYHKINLRNTMIASLTINNGQICDDCFINFPKKHYIKIIANDGQFRGFYNRGFLKLTTNRESWELFTEYGKYIKRIVEGRKKSLSLIYKGDTKGDNKYIDSLYHNLCTYNFPFIVHTLRDKNKFHISFYTFITE